MSLKILHVAPFNTSGVPITFVRAERALGHESRLVTLARDRRNYEEDICLSLPLIDFRGTRWIKKLVSHPSKLKVTNTIPEITGTPIQWRPNGLLEGYLVKFRERLWNSRIQRLFQEIDFWDFDIYQFDGGLEFFRDGRTVSELKSRGKKIICCYTGSDLRIRGVIPPVDERANLNVTLEIDHLQLHPNIKHVCFPFDLERVSVKKERLKDSDKSGVRIGHAPTNRAAKGSDVIIREIGKLQKKYDIQLDLIENVSYEESLRRKAECDLFVDQIGELGYGINSLEALAMETPACSCLAAGFEKQYPNHPFVVIDAGNIAERLTPLILDSQLRRDIGQKGKAWVLENHDSQSVVKQIHALLAQS